MPVPQPWPRHMPSQTPPQAAPFAMGYPPRGMMPPRGPYGGYPHQQPARPVQSFQHYSISRYGMETQSLQNAQNPMLSSAPQLPARQVVTPLPSQHNLQELEGVVTEVYTANGFAFVAPDKVGLEKLSLQLASLRNAVAVGDRVSFAYDSAAPRGFRVKHAKIVPAVQSRAGGTVVSSHPSNGFILIRSGGERVMCYTTGQGNEAARSVKVGDTVEFDLVQKKRGKKIAQNLSLKPEAPEKIEIVAPIPSAEASTKISASSKARAAVLKALSALHTPKIKKKKSRKRPKRHRRSKSFQDADIVVFEDTSTLHLTNSENLTGIGKTLSLLNAVYLDSASKCRTEDFQLPEALLEFYFDEFELTIARLSGSRALQHAKREFKTVSHNAYASQKLKKTLAEPVSDIPVCQCPIDGGCS